MSKLAKRCAKAVLGDYALYRIFRLPLGDMSAYGSTATEVSFLGLHDAGAPVIATSAFAHTSWYGSPEGIGYIAIASARIVGVNWYWPGTRGASQVAHVLRSDEVVSAHLEVSENLRGMGVGRALKAYAAQRLREEGYEAVISRVWHNNHSSIRVNKQLGSQQIGWTVQVEPLGLLSKAYFFVPRLGHSLR
jgi:GNAT superfamily N-acetyltransferase